MKNKAVIIFGCGSVGRSVKDFCEEENVDVIAFADNNERLWGTLVEDIPVISPEKVKEHSYDYIALGTFKNREAIVSQLLGLGVDKARIFAPLEQRRIFRCPMVRTEAELTELRPENYTSETNKRYESYNIHVDDEVFDAQLRALKDTLYENNIPLEKVCVVKGSVMIACGCRKSKKNEDLDIIMTSDLRELYGTGKVYINDNVEMDPIYYMHGRDNDEIINDPEKHFIYKGLKFMRLEDMYLYKKEIRLVRSNRDGLLDDIRMMKKFIDEHNIVIDKNENRYVEYVKFPE